MTSVRQLFGKMVAAASKYSLWMTLGVIFVILVIAIIGFRDPYSSRQGVSGENGNRLLQRGYENARQHRYAMAIPDLLAAWEVSEQISSNKLWHLREKGRGYYIPRPKLTLLILLGECYAQNGQVDEARKTFELAAQKWPKAEERIILYTVDWGKSGYSGCTLQFRRLDLTKCIRQPDSDKFMGLYDLEDDHPIDVWPGLFH